MEKPKDDESIFRKYSKRLRGVSPYRCLYLKSFQRAKRTYLYQRLYLENFLGGRKEHNKGGVIALRIQS
jgi:hypothetical protein